MEICIYYLTGQWFKYNLKYLHYGGIMSRILVVDDDRQFRSMLHRLLTDKGYLVDECSDGEYIDDFLIKGEIDLVFLDMIMERRGGMESLIEIRQKYSDVPVILISGACTELADDLLKTAEHLGAVGYLQKPFSVDNLFGLVDTVLHGAS